MPKKRVKSPKPKSKGPTLHELYEQGKMGNSQAYNRSKTTKR